MFIDYNLIRLGIDRQTPGVRCLELYTNIHYFSYLLKGTPC